MRARLLLLLLLFAVPRPAAAYQIFVKTLTGTTLTLEVAASDTIAAVKQQILSKAGFPVESQVLIFAGQALRNSDTLQGLGIVNESTLHMVACAKELAGDQNGEVHWDANPNAPRTIFCPQVVPKGVTLIVSDGAVIRVARSVEGTALTVLGKIKLQSSDPQGAPIVFTTTPEAPTTVLSIEPESGSGVVDDAIRGVVIMPIDDSSGELFKTTHYTTALRLAIADKSAPTITASQVQITAARLGVRVESNSKLQIDGKSQFDRNPTAIRVGDEASLIVLNSSIARSQQGVLVQGNGHVEIRRSVFPTVVDRSDPQRDPFSDPNEPFGAIVVNGPAASAEVWFSAIDLRGISVDKAGLRGLRVLQGALTAFNNTVVRQDVAGDSIGIEQQPSTTLTALGNLVVGFSTGILYQAGASISYNAVQPAATGCAYFSAACNAGPPPTANSIESTVGFVTTSTPALFQLPPSSPVLRRVPLSAYSPNPGPDIAGWPVVADLHVGAFQNPVVTELQPTHIPGNGCTQSLSLSGANLLDSATYRWRYKTFDTSGQVDSAIWSDPLDPLGSRIFGSVTIDPSVPQVNLQLEIIATPASESGLFSPTVLFDTTLLALVSSSVRVTAITPTAINAGETVTLSISGSDFAPDATVSFVFSESRGTGYRAVLATVDATAVTVLDSGSLTAEVTFPDSAPGGQWETRVTTPAGPADLVADWGCLPIGPKALSVVAKPNAAPTKPQITAPAEVNGARVTETGEVTATSTDSTPVAGKALTYHCTYATDAQFSDPVVVTSSDGTCRPETTSWAANSIFYVKVVASDGELTSEPSETIMIHYKPSNQNPDADMSGNPSQVETTVSGGGSCAVDTGNATPPLGLLIIAGLLLFVRRRCDTGRATCR